MTGSTLEPERSDDRSSHVHRQVIGWLGMALPLVIMLLAALRPASVAEPWARLGSLSAYYHTGAVPVFVGVLVAMGVFMLTYQGFENDKQRYDRWASSLSGLSAIGVAVFPTTAAPHGPDPLWLTSTVSTIHYVCAALLFLSFAYMSIFLFRYREGDGYRTRNKRDAVYLVCGLVIVASVVLIGVMRLTDYSDDIFWPETVAIWAFAVSWLTKGKVEQPIERALKRLRG